MVIMMEGQNNNAEVIVENIAQPLSNLSISSLSTPNDVIKDAGVFSTPQESSSLPHSSLALSGSVEFASHGSITSPAMPTALGGVIPKDGSDRSPAMSPNPMEDTTTPITNNTAGNDHPPVSELTINGISLSPSSSKRQETVITTTTTDSTTPQIEKQDNKKDDIGEREKDKEEKENDTNGAVSNNSNSESNTSNTTSTISEPPTPATLTSTSIPTNGAVSPSIVLNSVSSSATVGSPSMAKKKSVDDFDFGEVIGEGSFGEVRIATDKVTKIKYAAKILHKKQIVKENKVKYVSSEKAILDQLRHSNVVRLFFTFQTKEDLYYILELCPKGELLHLIKQAGYLDDEVARFYAAEVLSAIAYMHEKGVVHRDIKPENVLLNPDMHARLSDFGTAKEIPRGGRSQSFVGTAEYVCPELLQQRAAGQEADMWSFGVMLFQMLSGKLPFKGVSEFQVFQEISKNEYQMPENLSPDAKDLISKLLVSDPAARITANEAKLHPFFAGISYDSLDTTPPPKVSPKGVPQSQPSMQSGSPSVSRAVPEKAAELQTVHRKSPSILKRLRGDKNRNSSPAMAPINPLTPTPPTASSPTPSRTTTTTTTSSASSPTTIATTTQKAETPIATQQRRSMMTSSASSPQLSLQTLVSVDSSSRPRSPHPNGDLDLHSRARASTEFSAPPVFLSKPSDHSRWATFLTKDERILHSGVVQLRKKMFFARQKLFLFITDKRLALLESDSWKVQHEYVWGAVPITASLKHSKSFSLTTGNKVRLFEEVVGNCKELVELIQYLATPKAK